jgi:hypothetical protein
MVTLGIPYLLYFYLLYVLSSRVHNSIALQLQPARYMFTVNVGRVDS